VVLMPSFVNLGAYVDESTMIDTWSTVGSCAQIGKRVHISGGVGIGGVLEAAAGRARDRRGRLFHWRALGSRRRRHRAQGRGAGDGGIFSAPRPKIVDRDTGETFVGEVPEYAVVGPHVAAKPLKNGQPGPATACAVIVKRVDERTRAKTSINELLRD